MKLMNVTKFALVLMCWLSQSVYASGLSDELTQLLNSVQTMRANFTQTVYDNHGKAVQVANGKMAMQRPGKFRWEVSKPIPQLIVANDSRLWVYDPDLEQVTIRSMSQATGETPVLLLSNMSTVIDKDFTVKPGTESKSSLRWFLLLPRKEDSMFGSIQMGFLKNQLSEMLLKDNLGHTTRIQFKHPETNVALASSLFVFKPKANVDVIDETGKK